MSNDAKRRCFRFENLQIWQESRRLVQEIYHITKVFPQTEQFGLTSQMRRAMISVACNIAEGCGRNSDKDFAHFLEQSYSSLMEVVSLLYISGDLAFIANDKLDPLLKACDALAGQIVALNKSLRVGSSKVHLRK